MCVLTTYLLRLACASRERITTYLPLTEQQAEVEARGEDDEREARRRRKAVLAQARRRTEGSEHSGERRA